MSVRGKQGRFLSGGPRGSTAAVGDEGKYQLEIKLLGCTYGVDGWWDGGNGGGRGDFIGCHGEADNVRIN